MEIETVLKQIESIKHEKSLTAWEKDFFSGIAERAEKYGDDLHISDKQAAIINKIFEERVEGKNKKDDCKTGRAAKTKNSFPILKSDELPEPEDVFKNCEEN